MIIKTFTKQKSFKQSQMNSVTKSIMAIALASTSALLPLRVGAFGFNKIELNEDRKTYYHGINHRDWYVFDEVTYYVSPTRYVYFESKNHQVRKFYLRPVKLTLVPRN